jgi:hypothetical protein
MAALVALNNYLNNVLGITSPEVRIALNNQGLTDFTDFLQLTENDVGDLCSIARKPGGLIPNPAVNRRNPVAGLPPLIPNPGVLIGHLHEKRLKMLRYYLHHLKRVQRDFDENIATLPTLTDIYKLKEDEEEDEDPDLPGKLTTVDKVRIILEDIDDYLMRKRGNSDVPLAYVTRENVQPLDDGLDEGFGQPTYTAEMIRRAPHTGTHYENDNRLVWDLIRHVTHDGPGWSWVQGFLKTRNGRAAYLAIKSHYMGESFTARLRAKDDMILEKTFYDGKSRSFTFERYCEVLQGAFTDIYSTGEEVFEPRKIRILLNGIQDPRLSQAKSQVLATADLKEKFENAVNFLAQFLDEKKSYSAKGSPRNISSVSGDKRYNNTGRGNFRGTGRGNNQAGRGSNTGRGGRGGRGNFSNKSEVTDKYYSPQDWAKLTPEEQTKVRELRAL